MGDVAAEQQQSRDLSFQLQALKEAMEEIKKMVGLCYSLRAEDQLQASCSAVLPAMQTTLP